MMMATIATNSLGVHFTMLSNRAMFKLIAYNGYMYAMGGGATGFANGYNWNTLLLMLMAV